MATPTRIIVNLATGQITEVELQGAELETYNASLAQQVVQESVVEETPAPTEGE